MLRRLLCILMLGCAWSTTSAQSVQRAVIGSDTLTYSYTPYTLSHDKTSSREAGRSFSQWFNNQHHSSDYGTHFSIIGGPGYSAETNLRLSLLGRMTYRMRATSLDTPHSYTALSATASISGYYRFAIEGAHHFNPRHRLAYRIEARSLPTRIWGLDYDSSLDNPRGRYTSKKYHGWVDYRYNFTRHIFISATADYQYIEATNIDYTASAVIAQRIKKVYGAGIGTALGIDTRDSEINAQRGIYFCIEAMLRPSILGNISHDLWRASTTFDYYQPLWRGGTLAVDIYGEYHSAGTPWLLRANLGSDYRMRGYYPGRFNGECMATAQIELRQRIWQGLSGVVWGGCAEAFTPHYDGFKWRKILPNYGVGMRWAHNRHTSIRIDAGFGRDAFAIIVGLNEAF